MHILIIPSWYSRPESKLAGPFFRDQALSLIDKKQKVGIIYPYLRILSRYFNPARGISFENDQGILTYRANSVSWIPFTSIFREFFLIRAGMKLFEHYTKHHGTPDIIHAHSLLYGGLIAQKINKKFGIPYVVTEHRTLYQSELNNKLKEKLEDAAAGSSANIAVSENFRDFLNEYFENTSNWQYIPNMVNPIFQQGTKGRDRGDGTFVFCQISNLIKRKNPDMVVTAFAKEFKGDDCVKLVIGGDGELKSNLKSLIHEYQLESRVLLVGALTREKVVETYNSSDVCIVASDYETFGLVAAEALTCGKPVISTPCGGTSSIIRDKDGIILDKHSVSELQKAMRYVYQNIDSFDCLEIKQSAHKRFGSSVISEQLLTNYQTILNDLSQNSWDVRFE